MRGRLDPKPRPDFSESQQEEKGGAQQASNSALGVTIALGKRSSEHELKGVADAD
jgi:hypothetical protein